MHHKLRIGVLFGGQSAEHDISIMSAFNVINALDDNKYDIVPIGIDKDGKMYLQKLATFKQPQISEVSITKHLNNHVTLIPGNHHGLLVNLLHKDDIQILDIIFPVLHGPYGEDGAIQGLIKSVGIPFVGSDVLGSAICMDKDIAKKLLMQAGLPTADFITLRKHVHKEINLKATIKKVGLPCFVKPANLGSSIGISKVTSESELLTAINYAFEYDNKVLIEKYIDGREIECAVLGNHELFVTQPGEIVPKDDYYSYQAKYFSETAADVITVADLDENTILKIQAMAQQVFHCLECKGMARIDFFLTKNNAIYINEVNTLPGFTKISQYPKMCAASGIEYKALLDQLIELALAHYTEIKSLKTSP